MSVLTSVHGINLVSGGDKVVTAFLKNNAFEDETFKAWTAVCERPGAMVLDVGAYTGLYTLRAALSGARVLSFEPNPTACERLFVNARHNGCEVSLMQCAAYSNEGVMELNIPRGDKLSSASSLRPAIMGDPLSIQVQAIPLDYFLGLHHIDAIKIDVERAELPVLHGALNLFHKHKPELFIEVLDEPVLGKIKELLPPGYSYYPMDNSMYHWRSS